MTTYDDAIGNFAQVLADACAEQARAVATEGARAVAEQIHYPGGPLAVEEIQAQLEDIHGLKRQAA